MNCLKDVIVLSARPYSFTDEKTGEIRRGITVYYVENLTPKTDENGGRGIPPTKANFGDVSMLSKFSEVPGVYDVIYSLVPGSGGKVNIRYSDVTFKRKAV